MLAYHSDAALKKSVIAEMAKHRKADSLVQGYGYWKDGKGCAVGCLLKSGNHAEYEDKFGIPRQLAYLEDRIFEGLPKEEAKKWPERFLKAIPVGVDLAMVVSKLMYWLMTDPDGITKHALPAGLKAIEVVAALYLKRINGLDPSHSEWLSASKVARNAAAAAADAADAAAYAAAYAAAADAAYAAAYAAAADAAYAAADARKKYFSRIADKLIEILEAA